MCYTAPQGTVTVPIQVQFDFYSTYTPQPTTGCTITADFVDKKSFSPPYRPRKILRLNSLAFTPTTRLV